jgi:hypothetical protein
MRQIKYPESIFCAECRDHVKMTDCRVLERKVKGKMQVEFDYVCISCGHRSSANRDWEYLQYSEREFCQMNGVGDFGAGAKGQGVLVKRPHPAPPKGTHSGKYA